jgi:hypothetical protein
MLILLKAASAITKKFLKAASAHINRFPIAAGNFLTKFAEIDNPNGCRKPVFMRTGGVWKLFCDCTSFLNLLTNRI